jgi:hypothetical protein
MGGIFVAKSEKPNNETLSRALGPSYKHWVSIRSALEARYGTLTEEWKYYSASSGWTLKLLLRKRNLFFFTPCEKYFRIAFVFGDKAVGAIEMSDIPPEMIRKLKNTRKYAEGRGLRIEVKEKEDVKTILTLTEIKARH